MLNQKLEKELNKQLNKELFSAYLYMSMGAYFQCMDLPGFANWMHIQAQEEFGHAQKFYNFINERNSRVVLEAIDKPQTDWDSALTAFQDALKHEQFITGSINDLVTISTEEKDYATQIFLQWFVTEQVEEESSVNEVINKLKLMKDAPGAMFMLDTELGRRVLTAPTGN